MSRRKSSKRKYCRRWSTCTENRDSSEEKETREGRNREVGERERGTQTRSRKYKRGKNNWKRRGRIPTVEKEADSRAHGISTLSAMTQMSTPLHRMSSMSFVGHVVV